jgi:hypothetical protein
MWKRRSPLRKDGHTITDRDEPEDLPPSEWIRKRLEFKADEDQRRLLDLAGKRVILNCSRQ